MFGKKIRNKEIELYRKSTFLFNKKGYASTSIRQICREIGIRESSLYYYISSKEEILYNICERSLLHGLKRMEPIAKLRLRADLKLKKMIETHIQIITQTADEQSTMLKELRSLSVSNQRKIIKLRDRYQALFRTGIAECIQEGLLPDMPVKITTFALLGMMNWMIHWYSPDGPMKSEDIAMAFSALFFQGLTRKNKKAGLKRTKPTVRSPRESSQAWEK